MTIKSLSSDRKYVFLVIQLFCNILHYSLNSGHISTPVAWCALPGLLGLYQICLLLDHILVRRSAEDTIKKSKRPYFMIASTELSNFLLLINILRRKSFPNCFLPSFPSYCAAFSFVFIDYNFSSTKREKFWEIRRTTRT